MGFINIGGDILHTNATDTSLSLTSSTFGTTTITTTGKNIYIPPGSLGSLAGSLGSLGTYTNYKHKVNYILMGEEISFNGYTEINVSLLITSINVLGWEYYKEFKKQNCDIPEELEVILDQRYKSHQRDQKIDNIID